MMAHHERPDCAWEVEDTQGQLGENERCIRILQLLAQSLEEHADIVGSHKAPSLHSKIIQDLATSFFESARVTSDFSLRTSHTLHHHLPTHALYNTPNHLYANLHPASQRNNHRSAQSQKRESIHLLLVPIL
ncbi:hypothetical protein KCU83_g637, partial [Aureobasidium melanogenum]